MEIKSPQVTLVTARLFIRPFVLEDAEDLFVIRGDRRSMQYWDWPHDENVEQTKLFAIKVLAEMKAGKAYYWLARTLSGETAGIFDLSDVDKPTAELGFMVPRPFWGMGYGAEAAGMVVIEAWRLGILTISARIHHGNRRSAKLLRTLGFAEAQGFLVEVRPGIIVQCREFRLSRGRRVADDYRGISIR